MPFITGERANQQPERRAATRQKIWVGSWVASPDGSLVTHCLTSDASHRGVRVHPKDNQRFPSSVYYLDVKERMAYQAIVRWQDKTGAGLEFTNAYPFRELSSPQLQKVIASLLA